MNSSNFDYEGARNAGYNDDEIKQFLSSQNPKGNLKVEVYDTNPNFNYEEALKSGYSMEEINEYLSSQKPKKSKLDKYARLSGQFALGAAESALFPYEVAVAPLSIPGGQEFLGNLFTNEVLADVYPEGATDRVIGRKELKEPIDLSIRGMASKATGLDLHPEGIAEKAANWMGFLKDPRKIMGLAKSGLSAKDAIKAISPTGSEALRGLGAGTALQMAEDGNLGPIGTMASAIVGDIAGLTSGKGLSKAKDVLTNPKKALAETAASFTNKDKLDLQKEIINEFRDTGIQADLGTITDSNLIKWTQSRISQSGLTGESLREFSENLKNQIKREYGELAESLGKFRYETMHEAGETAKSAMKSIREADLAIARNLYERADKALKEFSVVNPSKLATAVKNLEQSLKPGAVKSGEQQAVLNILDKLKKDIFTENGSIKMANVKDLMNNKIALNDIINYEVQGGAKQLLKSLVSELDRAIISHGKDNLPFVKDYIRANKKFSEHAKTFRNRNAHQMLNASDPTTIMNKMGGVEGIRNVEKILSKTPEGKDIFNSLKRFKLDKMIGDNLIDSTTQQAKLGTFSKLLEKGKNREIARELMSPRDFSRLEKIQKNAGRLADAAQKFYNASKSGVVAADAAILVKGLTDVANLLSGNPWPLFKTGASIFSVRKLSSLLSDPNFLKLVEDIILSSEKNEKQNLINLVEKTKPYFLQALNENQVGD